MKVWVYLRRAVLGHLKESLEKIKIADYTKYQLLLSTIKSKAFCAFKPSDPLSRIVIFTERIETLDFLHENLMKDLKLKENQLSKFHGSMGDVELQNIVDDFGKRSSKIRILIASDVASEGINLHYTCNQLIHFDIPWSLMTFQQRNGRIDRYGQERTPYIYYLQIESENKKIHGDQRILEILIKKDKEAHKNIGDPLSMIPDEYRETPEVMTGKAIEDEDVSDIDFDQLLTDTQADSLQNDLISQIDVAEKSSVSSLSLIAKTPTLYDDEMQYFKEATHFAFDNKSIQLDYVDDGKTVYLTAPDELEYRFKYFPKEIWPENRQFCLTLDLEKVIKSIEDSRGEKDSWPQVLLLWEQNPIVQWLNDKMQVAFGRHEAPVVTINEFLQDGEVIYLCNGVYPNKKGNIMVSSWFGVSVRNNSFQQFIELEDLFSKIDLKNKKYPNNQSEVNIGKLQKAMPTVIEKANLWMHDKRQERRDVLMPKLEEILGDLKRLKQKKYDQLELDFSSGEINIKGYKEEQKQSKKNIIEDTFKTYQKWIEETLLTEDHPYIRIVAVIQGGN